MGLIRLVLGKFILLLEALFPPRRVRRSPERQAEIAAEARALALYQFNACPFCVITRREIRRLDLPIELRDVLSSTHFRDELVSQGGEFQVPCLRIEEPSGVRWMYESGEIIAYLRGRFAS
jgi:glutaredoxin